MEPLGQLLGLLRGPGELLTAGRELLVAVVDGRQTGQVAVTDGDELIDRGGMVLLRERVERVEARGELLQPFGVGVEPFALVRRRGVDVLQLLQHRAEPVGVVARLGVVVAQAVEFALGILELGEHPRLVVVETVAQRGERLANLVGMLQHGELLLQFGLFAFAQVGRRELLALEAEPLLVAAPLGRSLLEGGKTAAQLALAGVGGAVFGAQRSVVRHGVECRGAELLRGENQVLMLRVDVDELRAQLAQLRERHGHVVDEGAALARRRDDAREGALLLVVELVALEEGAQVTAREVEEPLDLAVAGRILDGRTVVLGAEQQPECAEQDGLAGARFAGDDVQMRVQLEFELLDERVVLDRKSA